MSKRAVFAEVSFQTQKNKKNKKRVSVEFSLSSFFYKLPSMKILILEEKYLGKKKSKSSKKYLEKQYHQ